MSPVSVFPFPDVVDLTFHIVSKGISANMLKITSKRRRTLKEIKAEKLAKEQEAVDT